MLRRLSVEGFKSLAKQEIEFPRLTVLFGPNASGKSNIFDAIQALSRIGTSRTLSDALSTPIRGHPIEAFAFPEGGLSAMLSRESAEFSLEAEIQSSGSRYRYMISIGIQPGSGKLSVKDENLAALGKRGDPKGDPSIGRVDNVLRIRRGGKPARPREEPLGLNYSILSDPRFSGQLYRHIERCRNELSGWRTYYLDPRVAMRAARPPADVRDVGVLGEDIAPFLYRLRAEKEKHYEAVRRTLRSLVPSVEDLSVDLDKRRGTLDILIRQDGVDFSSRIVSEGTLRVLALCAIAVNPWSGSVLAFEEPENGVHPRRLELIAKLLISLATADEGRQVIVTTHSPIFCDMVLKQIPTDSKEIALLQVSGAPDGTVVRAFDTRYPLLQGAEIADALTSRGENGVFGGLMMRGLLDE